EVLERGGVGRVRGDHDGVLHGAGFFEGADNLGDLTGLLADGDVDADEVAALLVDDGVERDGALTGGAVADDELALAASDRDHGVDGLDARLDGGVDALAERHTGGDSLNRAGLLELDGSL